MATGLGLFASAAAAHDFFLIPASFVQPSGRPLIVNATSSSNFPALNVGSPRSRLAQVRAMVDGHPAAVTVEAQTAQSLRLAVSGTGTGMAVVTVETIWGESNWRPDQVDTYLEEHPFKAEEVSAVRGLLPAGAALHVRSRRLAKTLVCVEVCTPSATGPTGLEVELLPEFDAGESSPASFQLVRNGDPLTAHPVTVRFGQGERREILTDQEGRLRLPEGVTGPVMLVAATLDRPTETGGRFITNNASLTFEAAARRNGEAR
ncbi:MAG: DUF4198 domain-containing protein [Alphaproteobacteria bacterium]|nr:DUF4198 domain-containing protein [Alphaproteobacteria bacterium]MBU2419246.1 DUF4198 domain-containing protein [Alphaproteobacteria bacterium]